MGLLIGLAKDLRHEFAEDMPQVVGAMADLLNRGGDRLADVLEAVFQALGFLFKYTQRQLAADLTRALRVTRPLRHQVSWRPAWRPAWRRRKEAWIFARIRRTGCGLHVATIFRVHASTSLPIFGGNQVFGSVPRTLMRTLISPTHVLKVAPQTFAKACACRADECKGAREMPNL